MLSKNAGIGTEPQASKPEPHANHGERESSDIYEDLVPVVSASQGAALERSVTKKEIDMAAIPKELADDCGKLGIQN